MIEIIISLCLLAFVVVRIRNIRRCHGFGVYAFPAVKTDKLFTTVYPGYIGGNSKDRRRILRRHRLPTVAPYTPPKEPRDRVMWNHRAVLRNALAPKAKPKKPSFPLRQKMKRTGAYLPSPAELKGKFRRVRRQTA
jgi:hypothetical protein